MVGTNISKVQIGSGDAHSQATSLSRLLEDVLPSVADALQVQTCWLHLADVENGDIALIGSYGRTPRLLLEGDGATIYSSLAQQTAVIGRPMIIEDDSDQLLDVRASLRQAQYHSLIIIPLQAGKATIGFLGIASSAAKFEPSSVALFSAFGKVIAFALSGAIERSRTRQFISSVAHEIKTPLTPIIASGELLAEELERMLPGPAVELITNILSGAQRLEARLSDLLDMAQIEAGTMKVCLQPVDVAKLLQDTVKEYHPVAERKGQNLIVDVPSMPVVRADRQRLEQIMFNLLSNATKFAPHGGCVTVRARAESEAITITVQDNGPGISREEQRHLFQPYFRGQADRHRFPGVGLGLTLSKHLVELQGGKMWVDSEIGKGSVFCFTLPLESAK